MGLISMGLGIHAYGRDARAWQAYGHMVAWVYGVEFVQYINSYPRVQRANMAQVQASGFNMEIGPHYYLFIHELLNHMNHL
jgi:hypothetical protein